MSKDLFLVFLFCLLGTASGIGVCHLSIDKGIPCMGVVASSRWGYNFRQRKCLKFDYAGCHGNNNRYKTEKDCRRACDANFNE